MGANVTPDTRPTEERRVRVDALRGDELRARTAEARRERLDALRGDEPRAQLVRSPFEAVILLPLEDDQPFAIVELYDLADEVTIARARALGDAWTSLAETMERVRDAARAPSERRGW